MTETTEAAPEEARDELETAISEALTRAWCMAVTYAAVNLASEGVPLGYPEAGPETAKLLAAVDAYAAAPESAPGEDHPRVVCLCGSTRFYAEFQQANYDLTMRGEIVLSVGFYPHAKAEHGHGEGVGHDSAAKAGLDELHKRKIDLADYVLVLNVGGYIGDSTRSEIAYAYAHGKPVHYLTQPPDIAAPGEYDPNHEPGLSECGCRMCDPGRHEDGGDGIPAAMGRQS
jgi:hypothetical protein